MVLIVKESDIHTLISLNENFFEGSNAKDAKYGKQTEEDGYKDIDSVTQVDDFLG